VRPAGCAVCGSLPAAEMPRSLGSGLSLPDRGGIRRHAGGGPAAIHPVSGGRGMTAIGYYELPGTAHYEWRADEGRGMCGWQDSGHVSPGLLAELRETLGAMPYYEIRVVVSLMDEAGVYAGLLIRAARLQGGT